MTEVIEGLYTAFARYTRPANMHHSPLAPGIKIYRAITRSPLREIPHEYISAYAARAISTLGNIDDFRHFLPRILELLADNLDQEMDPEEALAKLTYGQWQQWPANEQNAIRQYLQALWNHKSQNESEIDTWLCAIAQAEDDLSPYLATLTSIPKLSSAWWKNRPAQKQQAQERIK